MERVEGRGWQQLLGGDWPGLRVPRAWRAQLAGVEGGMQPHVGGSSLLSVQAEFTRWV